MIKGFSLTNFLYRIKVNLHYILYITNKIYRLIKLIYKLSK